MSNLVRLSFSLEEPLLKKLDELQSKSRYTNRSELIRDMIRERLVQTEWRENQEAVGTLTLVYDHQNHFESRLTPEAEPVARLHGTPGYPLSVVVGVTYRLGR